MKKSLTIVFLVLAYSMYAQIDPQDINQEIDQLKSPQSPAAVMLGMSDSEITRPSDVSDFMASLRQASKDFTSVPVNYAIDFSPHWIWKKKTTSAAQFLSNSLSNNFKQSFTVSVANNNNDISSAITNQPLPNVGMAVGIRFSFLRGNISKATSDKLDTAKYYMTKKNNLASTSNEAKIIEDLNAALIGKIKAINQMAALSDDQKKKMTDSVVGSYDAYKKSLTDKAFSRPDIDTKITNSLSGLDFTRKGFKLDFNSAVAWQFPDRSFEDKRLDQAGLWLSGGYELESNVSFLAIVRYQYFSKNDYTGRPKNDALDAGGRILFTANKFSISGEIVYRNNQGALEQGYKYLVNLDYKVGLNNKLNLSFGKDFNGPVTKTGNVISALNFLMGFGNKRKVSDSGSKS